MFSLQEATQAGLDNVSDDGVDTRGDVNNLKDDSIHAIVEDNFSTKHRLWLWVVNLGRVGGAQIIRLSGVIRL